jgi:hypothetical protein
MQLPWVLLALDFLGALLAAVGILALTGTDFGHPVLRTVAPGLIAIGAVLMAPIVVWAVRRAQARQREK